MSAELIHGIRTQSRLDISKAISIIENQKKGDKKLLNQVFPFTGKAYRLGITGPPGAGKSSLTDKLIREFRNAGQSVAVIGVDPTSPFTGGAVLGDRIRMTDHFNDEKVYIRSMATRGNSGGLSITTQDVSEIFDAAGFDWIIYETVGVGQIELDIIQAADTVLVVLVPESGDEVQMMKAGLMEIADIFAINKADRSGAGKLGIILKNLLSTITFTENVWQPEVVKTIASKGTGVDEVFKLIKSHRQFIQDNGLFQEKNDLRYRRKVKDIITDIQNKYFWTEKNIELLNSEMAESKEQRMPPNQFAEGLLNND